MPITFDPELRKLAGNRCEYCRIPDGKAKFRHVVDHIVARQHGGQTILSNLALCCGRCNLFKGPNIAGLDPTTGQLAALFHPRRDRWHDHFEWDGAIIVGRTPTGRVTVAVLSMNLPLRVAARQALMDEGVWIG